MRAAIALIGVLAAGPAMAEGVTMTPCAALKLPVQIDFENFPRVVNGSRHDDVLRFPGAEIGERFAGQVLGAAGTFDTLSATATAPLTLAAGAPGENLSVEAISRMQNVLNGIGPQGFERKSGSGEGAVAILFAIDQKAMGVTLHFEMGYAGAPPAGSVSLTFFGHDAALLGEITLTGAGQTSVCFQASGPGIAGVSLTNTDIQGISIDDIAFERVLVLG